MKQCRMWRVESRKFLFPSEERRIQFTDYLKTTEEKLIFEPKFGPIGIGPYTLLKLHDGSHPVWAYANWLFRTGEPIDTYAERFKYDQKQFGNGKLPPALWRHNRPGPVEDPYLREFWLSLPFEDRVQSIFGFAERDDCLKWFNTPGQFEWMAQNGFGLAEYRSKMIRHGLRQSVMPVNKPYELVRFLPFKLRLELGASIDG